jgi:hypothetical protein
VEDADHYAPDIIGHILDQLLHAPAADVRVHHFLKILYKQRGQLRIELMLPPVRLKLAEQFLQVPQVFDLLIVSGDPGVGLNFELELVYLAENGVGSVFVGGIAGRDVQHGVPFSVHKVGPLLLLVDPVMKKLAIQWNFNPGSVVLTMRIPANTQANQ